MNTHSNTPTTPAAAAYIAFEGQRRLALGSLAEVAAETKRVQDRGARGAILVFDARNAQLIELDLRGTVEDVLRRLPPAPVVASSEQSDAARNEAEGAGSGTESKGRGRPKLGVVPREVTLLPRHWEWLNSQPGGASVALRKLVEEARKVHARRDEVRVAREVSYRFMSAIASHIESFEEAARTLFAGDRDGFGQVLADWPKDVREHLLTLAEASWGSV